MTSETHHLKSLFFRNALSFALIFLFLGFIVNGLITSSLYRNIDEELVRTSQDKYLIARELMKSLNSSDESLSYDLETGQKINSINLFQTEVVLWDKDKIIANSLALGNRMEIFSNLKLTPSKASKIETITLDTEQFKGLRFRSLLVETGNQIIPYAQLLSNTNSLEESLRSFQKILIACMLFFWLISLGVSYYLAKLNIQPIIKSWKKQQEFVENASHELRTPLTIIQAKLEKLFIHPEHTVMDESETIAIALNEAKRLGQLTNSLLMLARSDGNQLVVNKELQDTQTFIESVMNPFVEIADLDDKKMEIDKNEAFDFMFDHNLMKQLLVIIIDNALKYTEMGDKITITSRQTSQNWEIVIADTGIGIKEEDLSQIFERFYREDSARQRDTGGHGLGLSIAKWITESHGGKIYAEHNQPKGSRFVISLPNKIPNK
ncbi:sensor histidine kinase [Vagococcus xieshaowenii]|uniref:histidine kinase n=1 Tax=Vagococcus xieshaowenii TaxID=2562451 RepID=A0AAJ5EGA9_9ENTE|nr:HAMP domain-containing sensor histidine kinase [Vagococcus xieshaowenii]QCA28464.1 HAMP domain-containing histidine kinase [Vagococcus xieshaowenii]TFZ42781.1 HAMP domain-containing histidine kinase [Vagococcus xieshaowenii]